jgi:hypothetical protein
MGRNAGRAVAAATILLAAGCASAGFGDGGGNRKQAQASYDSCLASAVHYADDGRTAPNNLALIVAPMCYQQYLALEKDIAASLGSHARREFELDADAEQVEFATAAIRDERANRQLAGVVPSR